VLGRRVFLVVVGICTVALAQGAGTATGTSAEIGKLTFHGELAWRGQSVDCPDNAPRSTGICRVHRGDGVVGGLGTVSEQYTLFVQSGSVDCPDTLRLLGFSGSFTVASKGTIEFVGGPSPDCQPEGRAVTLTFSSVTITGGTGIYSGASGSASLRKTLTPGSIGAFGKDVWDGSLIVSGLAFDTTAPVIRGAVTKTLLAGRGVKRVRVTYRVTARDETDGVLPVSCTPGTGSLFRVGRTFVTCMATDKSGNTAKARFAVTVKPRR
jgi:HYR domain-containing protein